MGVKDIQSICNQVRQTAYDIHVYPGTATWEKFMKMRWRIA
jgi:hypothetical protein